MYFSDRLYSNEELPQDFKLNVSEENEPGPSTDTIRTAERSSQSQVAAVLVQPGQREREPSRPRTETSSPTPAQSTGPGHRGEFLTILDSVEKEPLKLWQKEVSVYKSLNFLQPASFYFSPLASS